ncbi:hypothetical protein ACIKTA_02140 [Hansschlegelia beijingensis]
MRDEIASFPALRPHQRHAWHAFLVQVGAVALIRSGRTDPPTDEDSWRDLLLALTPDAPGAWSLVAPPDRAALLQPPLTSGLKDLRKRIPTPDALDMLVTSRNHDLKSEVMVEAQADDWLFALLTLQTMQGVFGAGNYGVSRMNGGYANRPAVGVVSSGGPGADVRRDMLRLIALRDDLSAGFDPERGLALVWLAAWDGATALRPSELDPFYVEICRRVRVVEEDGRIVAYAGGSKAARVAPFPGGVTGDAWTPIVAGKDGSLKALTVDAGGFGYRRMVQLIFGIDPFTRSRLSRIVTDDAKEGLAFVSRALTRGEGKTEGLHERRVPVSNVAGRFMSQGATDRLAQAATDRVTIAGEVQNRVLKEALFALFDNGPDAVDSKDRGAERRAKAFLARFDRAVDLTFFPDLWAEFEVDGEDARAAKRSDWVAALVMKTARGLLDDADRGASKAVARRYRARARADAVFWDAARKNPRIGPHLPERSRDEGA